MITYFVVVESLLGPDGKPQLSVFGAFTGRYQAENFAKEMKALWGLDYVVCEVENPNNAKDGSKTQ